MNTSTTSRRLMSQSGSIFSSIIIVLALLMALFVMFKFIENHVSADSPKITSGISGYCLDDHNGKTTKNSVVDAWKCNDTMSQDWATNYDTIIHNGSYCLSVKDNGKANLTAIVINICDGEEGQVWLRDQSGFQNPNSGLCLTASVSQPANQLVIDSCNDISKPQQTWTPSSLNDKASQAQINCTGSKGEKIACNAVKEWTAWQSGSPSHEALLNNYTDGAAYEEWCADFVSYVYKESGYPFSQGNADGWDENIAGNIQYMGFKLHPAASGYVPQPGDVAYFDYSGGHVEIVVSGGKNPTFVYGDSAIMDPSTDNGQMMANTITQESDVGQVIYYLSPD